MSGPNTNFDPVEVAALDPAAIDEAVAQALAAAAAATSLEELKAARTTHQGDRAALALANREIGALPPSAKAEAGKRVGQARGRVAQAYAARQAELEAERDERILVEEAIDVTLPTGRRPLGRRHPTELMSQRIADVFVGMGWEIAEGPEVEAEWFNFDALNFDADHPARQMQDTFYVDPPQTGLVLRTHTSPVQARALLERGVPLYIACLGRVFRTDELDATHMPAFHQVEGLAVDKGITMANLRGTLDRLAAELFGEGITTRLRPSYFPFTEPSAEMDISCLICESKGCNVCKHTGWVEILGSGMVHPKVLENFGIDSNKYTGFAFGMGVERICQLKYQVNDLRLYSQNDVRFLKQFTGVV